MYAHVPDSGSLTLGTRICSLARAAGPTSLGNDADAADGGSAFDPMEMATNAFAAAAGQAREALSSTAEQAKESAASALADAQADLITTLFQKADVDGRCAAAAPPRRVAAPPSDPTAPASGSVDFEEFMALMKHMHLDLSKEKALQIFSKVDRDQTGDLSLAQFTQAVEQVQLEVAKKALELMGLSRGALVGAAAASVGTLLMLLGFILVGTTVFADGGTFGSVVSSALPISAGIGLKASSDKEGKSFDVRDKVEEALDIVRS